MALRILLLLTIQHLIPKSLDRIFLNYQDSQPLRMRGKQSQQKGFSYYLIWYTNVALSIASSYYLMHLIANQQIHPFLITSKRQAYACFSLFLAAHVLIRWLLKQLKERKPSLEPVHTCLNNIINNSILYFVILLGLASSENYSQVYSEGQALQIIELFLWGRVIFSIGYIIGTMAGAQSLRSYGFGFCVASLTALFSPFLNYNFIDAFK